MPLLLIWWGLLLDLVKDPAYDNYYQTSRFWMLRIFLKSKTEIHYNSDHPEFNQELHVQIQVGDSFFLSFFLFLPPSLFSFPLRFSLPSLHQSELFSIFRLVPNNVRASKIPTDRLVSTQIDFNFDRRTGGRTDRLEQELSATICWLQGQTFIRWLH